MEIKVLEEEFSVTKVSSLQEINWTKHCFIALSDEEISLVCPKELVPESVLEREDGWKGFRIEGMLDFSLIGILAGIASILADHRIGIFVISTYNTDYIFVKKENLTSAIEALSLAGYRFKDHNYGYNQGK